MAKLVTDINGRHGEVDWTPIRYLNKGFSQTVLAGLYRTAQVGLVTPLHDGMNLVAKEYVAAQTRSIPACWCCRNSPARRTNSIPRCWSIRTTSTRMARAIATALVDAADRAPDALGGHDGEAARRHDPELVRGFLECCRMQHGSHRQPTHAGAAAGSGRSAPWIQRRPAATGPPAGRSVRWPANFALTR